MDEVHNENAAAVPMTKEEKEKHRRALAAARTRKWREKHPGYHLLHRSSSALSKEALAVENFWREIEQLRNWTESFFGPELAEYQFLATVMGVLLSECAKFADDKPTFVKSEDFVWIAHEIESFAFFQPILLNGLAERSKKFNRERTRSQRGPRAVSEWSALMEAGLIGEYLSKVRIKLEALRQPTWSPEMLDLDKDEMSVVYYLIDPTRRPSDIASLLTNIAKRCTYKGSKVADNPGELSNRDIRELLREMYITTPAVVDALLTQLPECSRGAGLRINRQLVEYGPPAILAAARMDTTPEVYAKAVTQQQEDSNRAA